jgi:hypothetical protein
MFGNWLNGVAKKTKLTLDLVCALYFGQFGMYVTIISLIEKAFHHFCRLSL